MNSSDEPRRGPGRPPGGPSKKRKADEELSTNANTIRARKRISRMSEAQLEVEKAKGNLQRTITRDTRTLQSSIRYIAADSEARQRLIQETRIAVEQR
jgi:hypothetical protein